MDPTWVSFDILCPIPGTEQYDDLLDQGLITEKNLDRFDTTHPMSGGVRRVRRDRAEEFLPSRRRTLDFELAPLPRSLQLPSTEYRGSQRLSTPGRNAQ